MAQTENGEPVWVRLHFVANTDGSTISDPIVGVLTDDTPTSFCLTQLMAYRQTDSGMESYTEGGMDFFNKAYVWRMEILPEPPSLGVLSEIEFI